MPGPRGGPDSSPGKRTLPPPGAARSDHRATMVLATAKFPIVATHCGTLGGFAVAAPRSSRLARPTETERAATWNPIWWLAHDLDPHQGIVDTRLGRVPGCRCGASSARSGRTPKRTVTFGAGTTAAQSGRAREPRRARGGALAHDRPNLCDPTLPWHRRGDTRKRRAPPAWRSPLPHRWKLHQRKARKPHVIVSKHHTKHTTNVVKNPY